MLSIKAKTRGVEKKSPIRRGGRTEPAAVSIRAMTDDEIEAAALSDPDAQPLTAEQLAKMRRVPRAKSLRWRLRLTQEEFSERYHIPLGTLRDWEQDRSEPDAPARAYLDVIAHAPDIVAKALKSKGAA